jgi:hypothetical protein
MYRSLRKAGFTVEIALAVILEPLAYPSWILPEPIDPERFGDYDDEDED